MKMGGQMLSMGRRGGFASSGGEESTAVEYPNAPWQIFYRYWFRPFPVLVVSVTLLASVRGLNVYAYAEALRILTDHVVAAGVGPAVGWLRLVVISLLLVGMELVRFCVGLWVSHVTIRLGQRMTFRLRYRLYRQMQKLGLGYHDRHSAGRLMTFLFNDVVTIMRVMTTMIRYGNSQLLVMVAGAVMVVWVDPLLGMLILIAFPGYLLAFARFRKQLRSATEKLRAAESKVNGYVGNRVAAFELVKAFRQELGEAIRYARCARPVIEHGVRAALYNALFTSVCSIISGICIVVVLWLSVLKVRAGSMTEGELVFFYATTTFLFGPAGFVTRLAGEYQRLRVAGSRVLEVLAEPVGSTEQFSGATPQWSTPAIAFEHVSFSYADQNNPALSDVSFEVPAGLHLCVMGPSGCGKSTLIKLLVRFYDPDKGVIRLDGEEVRRLNAAELRRRIGLAWQEPVILSGTVRQNIAYGRTRVNAESVEVAARFAQVHDDIMDLDGGYDALTYERGFTLSGGQRQRLNLARALAGDPRMLILDDTTSALDADTEARLISQLDNALGDRTAVIVSHRVSVALACDLLLVLDDGKVSAFGDPKELAQSPGLFAEMYQRQIDGLGGRYREAGEQQVD